MNHSCDPTTIIDTKNYVVIANRDIHLGEEINFFYPSTEWRMVQPFQCKCDAENCIKYVEGAYQLPIRYMKLYFINDHIKEEIVDLVNSNHHDNKITGNKKEIVTHENWYLEVINT